MTQDEALAELAKFSQEQELLDLIARLRARAIPNRKSVQEGRADRIADLLDEAATMLDGFFKMHFQ